MSVRESDVQAVAALARIGVPPERLTALAGELNGILAHMEILSAVDTSMVTEGAVVSDGRRLRPDLGPPDLLRRRREEFAPAERDGFFIVPRLESHDDAGSHA